MQERLGEGSPLRLSSGEGSVRFAGGYGSLGQAEHVGTFRVFGAAVTFVGREGAVGVDLAFEALEKLLTGGAGAGASVGGAAPRDFGRYLSVDVLAWDEPRLPPQLRSVLVSAFVSRPAYARLRADARVRRETRQTVRRALIVTAPL